MRVINYWAVLIAAGAMWGSVADEIKIGYSTEVENEFFTGTIHENVSNSKNSGSAFHPLRLREFPGRNLYRDDYVGLNFEHIFNGTAKDKDLAMFTPRKDRCTLEVHDSRSVTIHWPASDSSWAMECAMRYTLNGNGVDMVFSATPREQPQRKINGHERACVLDVSFFGDRCIFWRVSCRLQSIT